MKIEYIFCIVNFFRNFLHPLQKEVDISYAFVGIGHIVCCVAISSVNDTTFTELEEVVCQIYVGRFD